VNGAAERQWPPPVSARAHRKWTERRDGPPWRTQRGDDDPWGYGMTGKSSPRPRSGHVVSCRTAAAPLRGFSADDAGTQSGRLDRDRERHRRSPRDEQPGMIWSSPPRSPYEALPLAAVGSLAEGVRASACAFTPPLTCFATSEPVARTSESRRTASRFHCDGHARRSRRSRPIQAPAPLGFLSARRSRGSLSSPTRAGSR
jgi:hypothetical protein